MIGQALGIPSQIPPGLTGAPKLVLGTPVGLSEKLGVLL
jgi:hypothetical protein